MAGFSRNNKDNKSSVSSKIGTVISVALAISMIVMGAVYKDDCPAERYIHIYLIVMGVMVIVTSLLRLLPALCDDDCCFYIIYAFVGVFSLFGFAWFIAGNVWVYRLHGKYNGTDPEAPNFCNETFYQFAFWMLTVNYILLGVIILAACCISYCRS